MAIIVALLVGIGIFFYVKNTSSMQNTSNYEANRTSTDNTSSQEDDNNNTDNASNQTEENTSSENPANTPSSINEETQTPSPVKEEQIATFTTKIYSTDSARQNNINITCNTLNGTIVKNGTTFSFCNTVGQATSSKGYQKADIYDKNGNKKQGLGGRKLPN